jgi:GDP-L-fucose synthase
MKVAVFGSTGLVGSAIKQELSNYGYYTIIAPTKSELNLLDSEYVREWFSNVKPDVVFNCAALVGGIQANIEQPAQFIYQNIMISTNVIHNAARFGVRRLFNLGSSCIYPIKNNELFETDILTGPLEKTNEAYAVAKIAALKMCQAYNKQYKTDFITIMPCNLYGPNDNFDLQSSHFIPAMIKRFHLAKQKGEKQVILWGTGNPYREVMYSLDLAKIMVRFIKVFFLPDVINIGPGVEHKIKEYANIIKEIVHPEAIIEWDNTKPDGVKHKVLNIDLLRTILNPEFTNISKGIVNTYEWFKKMEE